MAEHSPLLLLARQFVPCSLPCGQPVLGSLRPGAGDGGRRALSSRQEPPSQRWRAIQIPLKHRLRHIRCTPVLLSLPCSSSVHKSRTYLPASVTVAPDAGLDDILIGFQDCQDKVWARKVVNEAGDEIELLVDKHRVLPSLCLTRTGPRPLWASWLFIFILGKERRNSVCAPKANATQVGSKM